MSTEQISLEVWSIGSPDARTKALLIETLSRCRRRRFAKWELNERVEP